MPYAALLLEREQQIHAHLYNGTLDVLGWIQREVQQRDVSTDRFFQFVFSHFYQLDRASLTDQFVTAYFHLLQQHKGDMPDLAEYARQLRVIPNFRGGESFHVSFISKLCATIDPTYPIYDKHIKAFYGLPERYTYYGFDRRLEGYLGDFDTIRHYAEEILADEDIVRMIADVRNQFAWATAEFIPDRRLIDLFIYALGATQQAIPEA